MYTCFLRPARKWEATSVTWCSPVSKSSRGSSLCGDTSWFSELWLCDFLQLSIATWHPLRSKWPLLDCQHSVLSYLETVFEALNKDLLFSFLNRWKKTLLTLNSLFPSSNCEASGLSDVSERHSALPNNPTHSLRSACAFFFPEDVLKLCSFFLNLPTCYLRSTPHSTAASQGLTYFTE